MPTNDLNEQENRFPPHPTPRRRAFGSSACRPLAAGLVSPVSHGSPIELKDHTCSIVLKIYFCGVCKEEETEEERERWTGTVERRLPSQGTVY